MAQLYWECSRCKKHYPYPFREGGEPNLTMRYDIFTRDPFKNVETPQYYFCELCWHIVQEVMTTTPQEGAIK